MFDDIFDDVLVWLGKDDDPELWQVALSQILAEVDKKPGLRVEIGRCSHWLRPHQGRWVPPGENFAWPTGYVRGGGFWRGLPEFDWSVVLRWNGNAWELARRNSLKHALRVTLPSRTRRHLQAAVHTQWMTKKEKEHHFFGFRKSNEGWSCTAAQNMRKLP